MIVSSTVHSQLTLIATETTKPWITDTTCNWVLCRAVAVAAALVRTISNTAVFTDKRWPTLALAEAIANPMALTSVLVVTGNFALVVNIPGNMVIGFGGHSVAAVFAHLLV